MGEKLFPLLMEKARHYDFIFPKINSKSLARYNYLAGIFMCMIPLCIVANLFLKEEEKFPAILGKLAFSMIDCWLHQLLGENCPYCCWVNVEMCTGRDRKSGVVLEIFTLGVKTFWVIFFLCYEYLAIF